MSGSIDYSTRLHAEHERSIPLTAFNTDPERLGKDADEFDPERFIDERRARYAEWKAGMDEGMCVSVPAHLQNAANGRNRAA